MYPKHIFYLALSFLSVSCAVQKNELAAPITGAVREVKVQQPPTCGIDISQSRAVLNVKIKPRRITPNSNGFSDVATVHIENSDGDRVSNRLAVFDERTCRQVISQSVSTSGTELLLQDADGNILEPGRYFATIESPRTAHIDGIAFVIGAADDLCELRSQDILPVLTETVDVTHQKIPSPAPLNINRPGRLCISIVSENGGVEPRVSIDGNMMIGAQQFADNTSAVNAATRVSGKDNTIGFGGAGGTYTVNIGFLPDSVTQQGIAENLAPLPLTCSGRLMGFEHPFEGGHRRPIARGGIPVYCHITFDKPSDIPAGAMPFAARLSQFGPLSDLWLGREPHCEANIFEPSSDGIPRPFCRAFPGNSGSGGGPGGGSGGGSCEGRCISKQGISNADGTFSIEFSQADFAAQGIRKEKSIERILTRCMGSACGILQKEQAVSRREDADSVNILDVTDVVMGDLSARLVTNARAGNSVDGKVHVINDLPVVIHEAFDPLGEDSSEYMVWLLGGQATDERNEDGNLAQDRCLELQRPCIPYKDGCRWEPICETLNGFVRCRQANILKTMLDAGYDVWLVDHHGDFPPTEVARRSPLLYQQIWQYPTPSNERRLAVGGLSSGAVAAKIALRSWELKDELPLLIERENLELVRLDGASALENDPANVVSIYLSFEGPHRGALIPRALQAYLKDPGLEKLKKGGNLPNLVKSNSASQLLQESVEGTDTWCFRTIGGTPTIDSCTVSPSESTGSASSDALNHFTPVTDDAVSTEDHDQFVRETIQVLGGPDGLPQSIRSVAISNGRLFGSPTVHSTATLLELEVAIGGRKYKHTLREHAAQAHGSTLPTVCRAGIFATEEKDFLSFSEQVLQRCVTGVLGSGIFGRIACFIGSGIVGPFGRASEIPINVAVPMRFPTFVPTGSALVGITREDHHWHDVLAASKQQTHFTVSEDACRFTLYHLDGSMKGDKDGIPACTNRLTSSCLAGGRRPGIIRDPGEGFSYFPEKYCSCAAADLADAGINSNSPCSVVPLPYRPKILDSTKAIAY